MAHSQTLWADPNQHYLVAALGQVRAALERHIACGGSDVAPANAKPIKGDLEEELSRLPMPPALETLSKIFGLSSFERDILLLCAGMELDSSFAGLCAAAQGDSTRPYPNFSLALAALPAPHWSAIVPRRTTPPLASD